jgi:phosphohistidine swiveling domain-containing protein
VAVSVDYQCLDGSPFAVTFARTDDVDIRWIIDREHAPRARTPLADAVIRIGRPGAEQAYTESGLTLLSTIAREPPLANGYDYIVDEPLPVTERDAFAAGLRELSSRYGGTRATWLAHTLPRVQVGCTWLQDAPSDTAFRDLAELRSYVWSHTAIAGVLARNDIRAVAELCAPVVGADRAEFVAYQLAQGHDNETVHGDVSTFAGLSTSWTIDHPTIKERADLTDLEARLLQQVRATDVSRDATTRRSELAASIRSALPVGVRSQFDARVDRLDAFTFVREARARWQLIATGAMRNVVRARGAELADAGVLETVDDVFFLLPDDYDKPSANVGRYVAARRTDHEHWLRVTPPAVIGNVSMPPPTPNAGDVIRGAPGAPGVASGTARVLVDLDEADRLMPGDVLVTTMTSPPWTPLFAVASAVVTDSGDALSHVAIAAREYGIPCVVGTNVATALVRDGETVIVDGDAGTVRGARAKGGGDG